MDGRFDLAENLPDDWPTDILGRSLDQLRPATVATELAAAHERLAATGVEQRLNLSLGENAQRRHFHAHLMPDETGVITIIADTTEDQAREASLTSLLREVSHRSKNLLAIVQSVAMQTAHHTGNIRDFLDRFRGRLHALSSTQDLVTESNWRGTFLQALIASQLARVGSSGLSRVNVTGDNPLLSPNASLHLGLAIHELGANAVLYGALSDTRNGQILIHAAIDKAEPANLVVHWQETGPQPSTPPLEPHFGTLVLERIVPLSVGGTADLRIDGDGVRYRLVVPADQFTS
jgi:two-component sensor histidine kinase